MDSLNLSIRKKVRYLSGVLSLLRLLTGRSTSGIHSSFQSTVYLLGSNRIDFI